MCRSFLNRLVIGFVGTLASGFCYQLVRDLILIYFDSLVAQYTLIVMELQREQYIWVVYTVVETPTNQSNIVSCKPKSIENDVNLKLSFLCKYLSHRNLFR